MKTESMRWLGRAAGAGVLALTLAAPALQAQSFNDQHRGRNDNTARRDNERFSVQGRVTSFSRERDGYRVQLDRGRDSYWVPQSYFRDGHNLRVGIGVTLGGILAWGMVPVIWSVAYRLPIGLLARRLHVSSNVDVTAVLLDFLAQGAARSSWSTWRSSWRSRSAASGWRAAASAKRSNSRRRRGSPT